MLNTLKRILGTSPPGFAQHQAYREQLVYALERTSGVPRHIFEQKIESSERG